MKGLLTFVAGAVVGAIAGAYLVKDKIMADAKEEINEVREYYKSKKEDKKEEVKEEQEQPKEEKEEYKEIVNNYVNYNKPEKIEQSVLEDEPYVIDVEEFGMNEEYDTMTLTYFADGVLTDDVDEVVEDPDVVVGLSNLKIFEEFGASAIYVRNEVWKTDFEILKDDWNWADLQRDEEKLMPEKKPHQL